MFAKLIVITAFGLTGSAGAWAQNKSSMKPINNRAPVTCTQTITIQASPEKVWQIMTHINNWATWQTEINYAQLNGELQPQTTFTWKTGGAKIRSTLHTVEPVNCFGWTGKTFGLFAIHNWTLSETNGRTVVRVEESMEGFFAQLFRKSFNRSLLVGMQNWLNLLKKECEK